MKTARRIAAMKAMSVIAGLATVVLGIATGNVTMVFAAAVVVAGAGLLAAYTDLREVEARSEAARMRNQTSAAIEPERDVQLDIQERLSQIKAYYARVECEPEGGERFRELVSAEGSPGSGRGY
jgi:hypothetical protein